MHCVTDNVLWIGNSFDARNSFDLLDQGLNVVVDLAIEEGTATHPREIVYLRFPIMDGIGNDKPVLEAAIRTISTLISIHGLRVAVCCSMGLSRSPALAAAAIALVQNQTPEESLSQLISRMNCDVSPGFWSEILKVYDSLEGSRKR
jgi:protein-tyrosine phosphatase